MKKPALEHDYGSAIRDKGRDQRNLGERLGRPDDGGSNHPQSKATGTKGESNVGEDLTSGDG
jgi:hypothetical protein